METSKINNLINSVIGTEEFKKLQKDVADKLFDSFEEFSFECDDDVRLVAVRVRDSFMAGLNWESTRRMTKLMGIDPTK